MDYNDYICGTKFKELSNAEILDSGAVRIHTGGTIGKYPILYCSTHQFNKNLARIADFNKEIVLITHNSDGSVRDSRTQEIREHDADLALLPNNVIRWYAQNVELDKIPDVVVPIPIGLENRYCFDYDKAEMLFKEAEKGVKKKNQVYVNFNINTNRDERFQAFDACQRHGDRCFIRMRNNGDDYERYISELNMCAAVVSPRGNGLDCHRTYEALYLNTRPVMKYIKSIDSFHLPIMFLNDWNEIGTADFHQTKKLDYGPLRMSWWANRISNAS